MTSSPMNTSRSTMRALLPKLEHALKSFQASNSAFSIVRTVNPSSSISPPSPKTLFILDSSFNPPSKAHLALARSALQESFTKHHASPIRFLLLFSTHNADKAPSAASFPQRLALMTIFAEDLLADLKGRDQYSVPSIDIGLTNAPYYTDKSAAIEREGASIYPDQPVHVHLMGFDTITRFFAAKYYPKYDPPFSALAPFFDNGHRLRVTLRPSEEFGTVESQKAFIAQLANGDMEADGGKKEWAKQINTVELGEEADGVSSTKVRKAAKACNWEEVTKLCTEGVATAVREESVYESDDRGSKMA